MGEEKITDKDRLKEVKDKTDNKKLQKSIEEKLKGKTVRK